MLERPSGEDSDQVENKSFDPVREQQQLLYEDLRFFVHHESNGSVGILTTSDLRFVTGIYPTLAKELIGTYQQLTTPALTKITQQDYIDQYLSAALQKGELITDNQARDLAQKVESGEHSLQVIAYAKQLRETERQKSQQQKQTQSRRSADHWGDYDDYDDDDGEITELETIEGFLKSEQRGSVAYRKGQILSVRLSMDSALEELYGEVDYKNALITEMLLQAPFISTVADASGAVDDDTKQRHLNYLNTVLAFADSFDPDIRFQKFEEFTQQYVPDSIIELPKPQISDFDRIYLESLYEFSRVMRSGEFNMENLYGLLQQTMFRRGTHFVVSVESGKLRMIPTKPDAASFDDVIGYDQQTAYFKTLLRRTGEKHPSINNVRLVLLASKPGLGKTLSITAFLNELPENARGLIFDHKKGLRRRNVSYAITEFAELARLHPDLHIFAGIEDINTNEYLQDELLDVESIIPGNFPTNLHLIATTNYPERIPDPLLRPGRTSEILIYEPTKDANVRKGIVNLHSRKQGVALSDRSMSQIARRTGGLTPDELAHIVRTISLECSENPTNAEIDRVINKIKERRNLQKKLSSFNWKFWD